MLQLKYLLKLFLIAIVSITMAEESTKIGTELGASNDTALSTQSTTQFPLGNLYTTLKKSVATHSKSKLSQHRAAHTTALDTAKQKIQNFSDKLQRKIVQTPNSNSNMTAKARQGNDPIQFPMARELKQDLQNSTHSQSPSPLLLPQALDDPTQNNNLSSSLSSLVHSLNELLFLIEKDDDSSPKLNLKIENLRPANTSVSELGSLLSATTLDKRIVNNADNSKNESNSTSTPVEMNSVLERSFQGSVSDTAAKRQQRRDKMKKKFKKNQQKPNFDDSGSTDESSNPAGPLQLKKIYIPVVYIN